MIYGDVLQKPFQSVKSHQFVGVAYSVSKAVDLVLAMEEYNLEEELGLKVSYAINDGIVADEDNLNNPSAAEPGIGKCYDMLDRMTKNKKRMLISTKSDTSINNMLKITQHFIDSWNPKDRKTVSGFLLGRDYKEMAKIEGKDESSLWRRRKSLAIDEYMMCKDVLQHLIENR